MSDKTIALEKFEAYMWDDLLNVINCPEFTAIAETRLQESDISFGDAAWTLVEGDRVAQILCDAWDSDSWQNAARGMSLNVVKQASDNFNKVSDTLNDAALVAIAG
jgi:hypothetical protein